MSDDRDLTRVEDLLRSVPTPLEVPPRYAPIAKAAALGGEPAAEVVGSSRRGSRSPRRLLAAAAVLAVAVAVTLAIGVNGTHSPSSVQATVALSSGSPQFANASGSLELGKADGAMRTGGAARSITCPRRRPVSTTRCGSQTETTRSG